MQFKTTINIEKSSVEITYHDPILLIGSCFIEHIGKNLINSQFNADINPFGVIYNPLSVKKSIEILINNDSFSTKDIFEHNELWHSFSHHSRFSAYTADECLFRINERIKQSADFLAKARCLIITFGTASVYYVKETNEAVSNCHKLPENHFYRKRLSAAEIASAYNALLNKLKSTHPDLKIIFTVSPVRYLHDGAYYNQLNKATLLLAIEEICNTHANCSYFPAYELLLDDLRDYRFYEKDMIHPNELAVEYIWERFKETHFSKSTQQLFSRIEKINKAIAHKPFNPETKAYREFVEKTKKEITALQHEIPHINLQFPVN